jgi:hypothetical protein
MFKPTKFILHVIAFAVFTGGALICMAPLANFKIEDPRSVDQNGLPRRAVIDPIIDGRQIISVAIDPSRPEGQTVVPLDQIEARYIGRYDQSGFDRSRLTDTKLEILVPAHAPLTVFLNNIISSSKHTSCHSTGPVPAKAVEYRQATAQQAAVGNFNPYFGLGVEIGELVLPESAVPYRVECKILPVEFKKTYVSRQLKFTFLNVENVVNHYEKLKYMCEKSKQEGCEYIQLIINYYASKVSSPNLILNFKVSGLEDFNFRGGSTPDSVRDQDFTRDLNPDQTLYVSWNDEKAGIFMSEMLLLSGILLSLVGSSIWAFITAAIDKLGR